MLSASGCVSFSPSSSAIGYGFLEEALQIGLFVAVFGAATATA
jgi:hypothetical protein